MRVGRIDSNMTREDVVACRQGEILLVEIGKAYFKTIGLASAVRATDKEPLVYMS